MAGGGVVVSVADGIIGDGMLIGIKVVVEILLMVPALSQPENAKYWTLSKKAGSVQDIIVVRMPKESSFSTNIFLLILSKVITTVIGLVILTGAEYSIGP